MDAYIDDQDFLYQLFVNNEPFVEQLMTKDGFHLEKSKSTSVDAREVGNKLYRQQNHDQDIHNKVLLHYTKSIAFAPEDSEELALAFGNRSALLLHLHRYEECIRDIDRALAITKSDQLKAKFQSRKERATEILKVEDQKRNTDETLELPNIIKSTKISCATESVSIEKNESYKQQLTATRDIKPGEVVIIEKAYACCVHSDQIYRVCSHCLSFTWNGIPCNSCVHSIYCSETCKKEALAEYHDIECSILPFFYVENFDIDPSYTVLLARMFIKAVKAEGFENLMEETELIDNAISGSLDWFADGTFNENKFGFCYSLRCRPKIQRLMTKDCFNESLIMYLLIKYTNLIPTAKKFKDLNSSDEKVLIRLRDIFMKLSSIINLNGYSYQWYKCNHANYLKCRSDKCYYVKGSLIAPCSGIINHSCVPNLTRLILPEPKVIIYATKTIKKGEQLFITYGPVVWNKIPREENTLSLEKLYYTCKCIACTDIQSFIRYHNKKIKYINTEVAKEFKRIFGDNAMTFFLTEDFGNWTILNEESLQQAYKLTELFYKYYARNEAYFHTMFLGPYIRVALHKLYGEKRPMLSDC